tara:strand:+ start:159 stop:338 length:180 start_codon:yes stop_codon:yes gene_type:complete
MILECSRIFKAIMLNTYLFQNKRGKSFKGGGLNALWQTKTKRKVIRTPEFNEILRYFQY